MEMLRIVSMFLVMTVHAGFMAAGVPTQKTVLATPAFAGLTFIDMAFSVVCVNTFVMISGWFGIKWNLNKIYGLFFQVLFFSVGIFAVMCIVSPSNLNVNNLASVFLLHTNDYWFVKSYLILYLFAPLLNNFAESTSKKQLGRFLAIFFVFQTVYAWISINGAGDFLGGYSALSFSGLYLLARFLKKYGTGIRLLSLKSRTYFLIFICLAMAQSFVAFILTRFGLEIAGRLFTYTNPIVIMQTVALLLAFAKMKPFHSKAVNWIACSCFAVYLLHANELLLRPHYARIISEIYTSTPLMQAVFITFAFICVVFAAAIICDKARAALWKVITYANKTKACS